MNNFENKVVLVTGGARGIGKAITKAFWKLGAKVIIAGRNEELLKQVKTELAERIEYVVSDVGEQGAAKTIIDATIKHYGQLDVVVNNAGLFAMAPLANTSDQNIEEVYKINVFGPLAIIREATEHLAKTQGSVVNLSSNMSTAVMAPSALYSSTKAAIDHSTRLLAAELGPQNIRINAVAPGFTKTDMTSDFRSNEEAVAGIVAQTPLGRVGEPEDIANVVVQLSEKRSSWVTGQIVQVSGGLML